MRGALSSSVSPAPGGPEQRCVDECSEIMDEHTHPSNMYHRLTERLDEVRTIVVLQSYPAYSRRLICLLDFLFVFHLLA